MIVYINNSKNSIKELLQLINTFSNVAGYKTNSKKNQYLSFKQRINGLKKKSEKHHPSQ